jgi:hypothetical protein
MFVTPRWEGFSLTRRQLVRHEFAGDEELVSGTHPGGERSGQSGAHLGLVAVHGRAVQVPVPDPQGARYRPGGSLHLPPQSRPGSRQGLGFRVKVEGLGFRFTAEGAGFRI